MWKRFEDPMWSLTFWGFSHSGPLMLEIFSIFKTVIDNLSGRKRPHQVKCFSCKIIVSNKLQTSVKSSIYTSQLIMHNDFDQQIGYLMKQFTAKWDILLSPLRAARWWGSHWGERFVCNPRTLCQWSCSFPICVWAGVLAGSDHYRCNIHRGCRWSHSPSDHLSPLCLAQDCEGETG